MNSKNKGLQKFTNPSEKVKSLLQSQEVTKKQINDLSKDEYNELFFFVIQKINSLEGIEKLVFGNRFYHAFNKETRNQLWENNHIQITGAIDKLMKEYNRMPSCTEISVETGLSRSTVNKHLKKFRETDIYQEQTEQFLFMVDSLLARLYKFACQGDMRAAKLFLDLAGSKKNIRGATLIENQNNFIQINGVEISQETIKHLNTEQLSTIENILKTAIPSSNQ